MSELRKHKRFFVDESSDWRAIIELSEYNRLKAVIRDISRSGMCIATDLQTFLQFNKYYHFTLQHTANHSTPPIHLRGRLVWYLRKEFRGKDSLLYGIHFEDLIDDLPESLITNVSPKFLD